MTATEFERRLRKLAVREGMTFATFNLLDEPDRAVLRATIVACFEAGAVYTERAVNERLKGWLAGVGRMITTDHVSLRRLLVDTQVLTRTPDCADYRVQSAALGALSAELAAVDARAVVAAARHEVESRRAARKAAWLKLAGGTGTPDPA